MNRWLKVIVFLAFSLSYSSKAKTVDAFIEQYRVVPCSGIETKLARLDKRKHMINKVSSVKKKKELKAEYKALKQLFKRKQCIKIKSKKRK